jgi:hypothetical protein
MEFFLGYILAKVLAEKIKIKETKELKNTTKIISNPMLFQADHPAVSKKKVEPMEKS